MHSSPPIPLLTRMSPGAWTTLAWCAGAALTFVFRVRLPGESEPADWPAIQLYRWDGLLTLAVAGVLTAVGGRRLERRPLAGLCLMLAAAVASPMPLGVGEIPLPQYLAVIVALYFVAAAGPRRTGAAALALALAVPCGYLAVRAVAGWNVGASTELAVLLTAVISWLIGNSARQSREHAASLADRSAAQAVTAERLRIAREMHDMIAHTMGIVALQAGAARRVLDTQPERARSALGEVENASRETLSGLRRMLVALRGAEPGEYTGAPEQACGLGDVGRLAATTTAAGVRVDVRWRGEQRPLPPEIDVSAYRIIQEAVTNVVRHAAARSCRVTVEQREGELAVEIVDAGTGGGRGGGTGFGLAGMRERVALLHGEFAAAPRPGGGFRVAARLPVPAGVR
ncbi:sensor histidine kinase [Streptomyces boncukensis]|uniref:histidine kinase n=1 Tax=Streptomyces boncukensis TaxID=2711219 RepID=A0A6G4WYY1_9ACTN|nr:histidine kinase [Streptomyces boncukensis]NGO70445.1 sensor histidine kinase [Streptomyces boncukensis]